MGMKIECGSGMIGASVAEWKENPMIEAVFERASVRKFADEPVSDDDVRALLRAAMAAPSAGNQQPWEFYVVRDAETLRKLSETTPYAKAAAGAPCAIVPCARTQNLRFPSCVPQDMSAAIENLLLGAVDMGLGAVWMGIAPEVDRVAAVAEVLDVPVGLEPFAIIPCGFPVEHPEPRGKDRFDESRIHWAS